MGDIIDFFANLPEMIRDWLIDQVTAVFTNLDSMTANTVDILTDVTVFDTGWDYVIGLSGVLKPFCLMIIGICCLIELANIGTKMDLVKWEHGLKIMIKMCLARVFLDIAPVFCKACYFQTHSWIASVGGSSQSIGTLATAQIVPLLENNANFGELLGLALTSFLVIFAINVCGMLIQVMAYGRLFELFTLLVASPVPCAFFPLGGDSGGAMGRITSSFLKNFAAVCLQGVMMLVVIRVYDIIVGSRIIAEINTLTSGSTSTAISNVIFTMLLGSVALVMAVTKCGEWSKKLLDAV